MAGSKDQHEIVLKTMTEVEALVREQTQQRARANPGADWNQIIEIEIGSVKVTLERLVADFEDEGEDTGAALVRSLIDDWLPILGSELRAQH